MAWPEGARRASPAAPWLRDRCRACAVSAGSGGQLQHAEASAPRGGRPARRPPADGAVDRLAQCASSRAHQLCAVRRGAAATADSTSSPRARVVATYSALISSRWRAACSSASASAAAGRRLLLAGDEHEAPRAPAPRPATRPARPWSARAAPCASVSSISTSSASRPLAPCTVSSCTASAAASEGARTPPARSARTSA